MIPASRHVPRAFLHSRIMSKYLSTQAWAVTQSDSNLTRSLTIKSLEHRWCISYRAAQRRGIWKVVATQNFVEPRQRSSASFISKTSFSENDFVGRRKRVSTISAAANGSRDMVGIGRKKSGPKTRTHWVCEQCGESFSQWWGSCRNCKAMNSMKEFREPTGNAGKRGGAAARAVENLGQASVREVSDRGIGVSTLLRSGSRTWLENVGGGPQRLSDVAKGHSQLHWRLPLYDPETSTNSKSLALKNNSQKNTELWGINCTQEDALYLHGIKTVFLVIGSPLSCQMLSPYSKPSSATSIREAKRRTVQLLTKLQFVHLFPLWLCVCFVYLLSVT